MNLRQDARIRAKAADCHGGRSITYQTKNRVIEPIDLMHYICSFDPKPTRLIVQLTQKHGLFNLPN